MLEFFISKAAILTRWIGCQSTSPKLPSTISEEASSSFNNLLSNGVSSSCSSLVTDALLSKERPLFVLHGPSNGFLPSSSGVVSLSYRDHHVGWPKLEEPKKPSRHLPISRPTETLMTLMSSPSGKKSRLSYKQSEKLFQVGESLSIVACGDVPWQE